MHAMCMAAGLYPFNTSQGMNSCIQAAAIQNPIFTGYTGVLPVGAYHPLYHNMAPMDALPGIGNPGILPFGSIPISPEAMIYYQKMVELEVSRALKGAQVSGSTTGEQCPTQTGMVEQTPTEKVGTSSSGYHQIPCRNYPVYQ